MLKIKGQLKIIKQSIENKNITSISITISLLTSLTGLISRCNETTILWKFMKIHYFSQKVVDHSLKASSLSRPYKDLKILQFLYFLKFLRTKIATFFYKFQDPRWQLLNLVKICQILNSYQAFERIRLGNSGSYENSK